MGNPANRHKRTIKERWTAALEKRTAFFRKRQEENKAENEREKRDWHNQQLRDKQRETGRYNDRGESSHNKDNSQADEEQRRLEDERRQQMLQEQRDIDHQRELDRLDDDRRRQDMDRERQNWP